jgi:heat shock protein 4
MITNRIAVVGLEVGTGSTHMGLARGAKVQTLQNDSGSRKTPSVVAFTRRCRLFGSQAVSQQKANAANTINDIMQLIGMTADDAELADVTSNRAFKVRPATDELQLGSRKRVCYPIRLKGQEYDVLPETALAYMLSKLKVMVETETKGQNVEDCVLAVPGYWTDRERRAVLTAVKLGGWNPLRLMNENCALALYYGLRSAMPEQPISVLFLDSGRSHTSLSLVELKAGQLRVKACAHDATLGGRAFDVTLYNHLAADIKTRYNLDVGSNVKAQLKLMTEVEKIKHRLSANREARWAIEFLMNDTDVKGSVTRDEFDRLCEPLYARATSLCSTLLASSGIEAKDLHSIEVVGGCTRVPAFKERLQAGLGKNLSTTCDSDEGVVRGCTLECAHLSSSTRLAKVFKAIDICNRPVDVVWEGKDGKEGKLRVFKPGDNLPCVKKVPFKKRAAFSLKLRYDRAGMAEEKYSGLPLSASVEDDIGLFTIDGPWEEYLTEFPQEKTPTVNVYLTLDRNGLCFVTESEICLRYFKEDTKQDNKAKTAGDAAAQKDEGEKKEKKGKMKIKTKPLTVTATYTNGFTPAQEEIMAKQLAEMAAVDQSAIERDEASNSLESYILSTQSDLRDSLEAYLSQEARAAFEEKLQAAENWLYDDAPHAETEEIKAQLAALQEASGGAYERKAAYSRLEQALGDVSSLARRYTQAATHAKYAHLSEEDHKTIAEEAAALTAWVAEKESKLAADRHANPTTTHSEADARRQEAQVKVNPLLAKKATAEQAKEAEEQAKKSEEEKASDHTPLQIEG